MSIEYRSRDFMVLRSTYQYLYRIFTLKSEYKCMNELTWLFRVTNIATHSLHTSNNLNTSSFTQYSVYNIQCTLYSVQCIQCSRYTVQPVYSTLNVKCTMYVVHCKAYSVH